MIFSGSKFDAFLDVDLRGVLENRRHEIVQRVTGDEDDSAIELLTKDFWIEPIVMDEKGVYVTDRDEMIPAEWFPNGFWVDPGKQYAKKVVRYHIPFTGEQRLLHCKPSTFVMRTEDINADGGEISFDIVSWNNDAAQVKNEIESVMRYLREQNGHVGSEVQKFNDSLRMHISAAVAKAKEKNNQGDAFMSSLGVPRKPNV